MSLLQVKNELICLIHITDIQFFFGKVSFWSPHRDGMRLSLIKSDKQKHKHNKFEILKLFSCFCFPLHNIGLNLFLVQHPFQRFLPNKCLRKFFFVTRRWQNIKNKAKNLWSIGKEIRTKQCMTLKIIQLCTCKTKCKNRLR